MVSKVVEQFLGRKLRSDEIVHHIDGNECNNEISNLRVMSSFEHLSLHKAGLPRTHTPTFRMENFK